MDEIDLAQQNDELYRRQALMAHLSGARSESAGPASGRGGAPQRRIRCCIDCGEEIDPGRRRVHPGAVRCVACQEALERRSGGQRAIPSRRSI